MSKIFFTSDTHAYHRNITKGVSNWDDKSGCRDFNTLEEMNQSLVNGINSTVGEDDILFFLGDWSFGGIDNIWNFRKQLKVKTIHAVGGNHDHFQDKNKTLPNCKYNKSGIIVDGNPEDEFESVGAQELFSSYSHYKEVKIDGKRYCLSHYAFRVWNKSHHGSIMLHGHSHDTLPFMNCNGQTNNGIDDLPLALQMDVGIDVAFKMFGEYRPFSLKEIQEIMSEREALLVDHHNKSTN